jgi:hypothetical protein
VKNEKERSFFGSALPPAWPNCYLPRPRELPFDPLFLELLFLSPLSPSPGFAVRFAVRLRS